MKNNALDLFLRQKRFDLIFKYLYLKNKDKNVPFFTYLYAEHIHAFNNFFEVEPSDGVAKQSKEDFINSFNNLYESMKSKGFDSSKGLIPVGNNGEISDGAHRLAAAAVLGLDIETENDGRCDLYDYKFFQKQKISPYFSDYAALEYIKLNPNAYIVNLHSVADREKDGEVENILNKYGFVYYQKDVNLTFNGYVNLKKISYGSFWDKEGWIGNVENKFAGAQSHAKQSMGKNPLRAYVFVCDSLEKVIQAKAEIRELFNIGNFSVHINDTREEAIWLAETYFNENSLQLINARPFDYEDAHFDKLVAELKTKARQQNINLDELCGAGSTPLNILGLRSSDDLDFLYAGNDVFDTHNDDLSNHNSELSFYPLDKTNIIYVPQYHFYYSGLKFISLDILYQMKKKRNENPKDIDDCKMIEAFRKGQSWKKRKHFKIFEKIKFGNKRKIILFGFIKITYRKRKKKSNGGL